MILSSLGFFGSADLKKKRKKGQQKNLTTETDQVDYQRMK